MNYVVPSQQLPPVYSTTAVSTDLVYPQFSYTAVEPSAPCVDGSLPPVEEFTGPMDDQVLQEHIAASEFTEKPAEIPVVHEQVIVQDIPEVVVSLPPAQEFFCARVRPSPSGVRWDAAGAVGGRSGGAEVRPHCALGGSSSPRGTVAPWLRRGRRHRSQVPPSDRL